MKKEPIQESRAGAHRRMYLVPVALAGLTFTGLAKAQACTWDSSQGADLCSPPAAESEVPIPDPLDDNGIGSTEPVNEPPGSDSEASLVPRGGGSPAPSTTPVVVDGGAAGTVVSYSPNLREQPRVTLPVRLRADGLVEEIGAIGLHCTLESSLLEVRRGRNHRLAWGFAMAVRSGQNVGTFVDGADTLHHTFSGDSVDLTFNVPFFTSPDSLYPVEYWTHGNCVMHIHHDNAEDFEFPHTCTAQMMADAWETGLYDERVLACVWPGTDPELAEVTFSRPGLEGLNAVTGQLGDVARQASGAEDDQ